MTTVHYVDNGQLAMDQYSSLGKRPSMVAIPDEGEEIIFRLVSVGNMPDPNELHISFHSRKFNEVDQLIALWAATRDQAPASSSVFRVQ